MPALETQTNSGGEKATHRLGHRPLLGPAQALFLAEKLYGIHIGPGAGRKSDLISPATDAPPVDACIELPSYDDRNFLITGGWFQGQTESVGGPSAAGSGFVGGTGASPTCGGGSDDAGAGGGGNTPISVVLKVHNSLDSGRTAQLQAIDEAMLRLQAAGVLTNTPLRPVGQPQGAGSGGEGDSDGGGDAVVAAASVRYTIAVVPTEGTGKCGGSGTAASGGGSASGEGTVCCWARLPCTCHPPPPAAPGEPQQRGAGLDAERKRRREGEEGEEQAGETQEAGSGQGTAQGGAPLHWHVVRCLSYIPGKMLASVPYLMPSQLLSLGRLMGRVTRALADWRPPALLRYSHDWHPESGVEVLRRVVPAIAAFDQDKKSVLLRVADELRHLGDTVLGDPGAVPRQICHADANDDNCVLSADGREVVGLIDFGDMAFMPRVCEVAITMIYAVLLAFNIPMEPSLPARGQTDTEEVGDASERRKADQGEASNEGKEEAAKEGKEAQQEEAEKGEEEVARGTATEEDDRSTLLRLLRAAGLVLAGYQSEVRLLPEELALLLPLMRGRLAQSLTLGAASVLLDPGNAAYLLMTQRPGWRVIRLLTPGSVMADEEMLCHLTAVERQLEAELLHR